MSTDEKYKKLELLLAETRNLADSLQAGKEDFQQIIGRRQSLMDEIDALDNRMRNVSSETLEQRQILAEIMEIDGRNRVRANEIMQEIREKLKELKKSRNMKGYGPPRNGEMVAGRVLDKKE